MWRPGRQGLALVLTPLLVFIAGVPALRDVQVTVPEAAAAGDTVTLLCTYNMETDSLYSIKWYRGREEFFRYIPKELPHTKVFPLQGIDVDVSRSGAGAVVLRGVTPALSGRFRCEVSADAPTFHTAMKTSYMHVVELPDSKPWLLPDKTRVYAGDRLRVRCTAPASYPPSNLTWTLNNATVKPHSSSYEPETFSQPINPHVNIVYRHSPNETKLFGSSETFETENRPSYLVRQRRATNVAKDYLQHAKKDETVYQHGETEVAENNHHDRRVGKRNGSTRREVKMENEPLRDGVEKNESGTNKDDAEGVFPTRISRIPEPPKEKKRTVSWLNLDINQDTFYQGRIVLTCTANVFTLFKAEAQVVIYGEKPQLASVTGTRESGKDGSAASCITRSFLITQVLSILWYTR